MKLFCWSELTLTSTKTLILRQGYHKKKKKKNYKTELTNSLEKLSFLGHRIKQLPVLISQRPIKPNRYILINFR